MLYLPIDIEQIIDFMHRFTMKPTEVRKTVEHYIIIEIDEVLRQVLDAVHM